MRNYRYLLLLTLLFSTALNSAQKQPFEVLAGAADANGSVVNAYGDVVVLYKDYYITSKSSSYNKESEIIEFYDNVCLFKGDEYYTLGEYAKIDLNKETKELKPFFTQERETKLWITSKKADSKGSTYRLDKPLLSSCNPNNPDWRVEASSTVYDRENRWMKLYNPTLFLGSVPILYSPYYAYPTDKTRRSGLLKPSFGLSSEEGIFFLQPIYFAPEPWWDIEISPQVRTNRGYGLYSTLRFVDTANSHGFVKSGFFKEQKGYADEHKLKYNSHQGLQVHYERRHIFDSLTDGEDGLYIDYNQINDVDYFTLQGVDDRYYNSSHIVTSKANYFLNQEKNYYGVYAKYFIDTGKVNNDDTLQLLPELHYHRYLETFLIDNLKYSFDYRFNNHYRVEGLSAQEQLFSLPIGYHISFFDEYLIVKATENISAAQITFNNSQTNFNDESSYFLRNSHNLELYSDLVKAYDNVTHSLQLGVGYMHPGDEKREGFYKDEERKITSSTCLAGDPCEFTEIESLEEEGSIRAHQFLYDLNGKELLYHRLTQPYFAKKSGKDKWGDIENEIRFGLLDGVEYYSDTFYSYKNKKFSKTANSLKFSDELSSFVFSHVYQDNSKSKVNYANFSLSHKLTKKYSAFANYAYDFIRDKSQNWSIGWAMSKRCWNYRLTLRDITRPVLTQSGASSIHDKIILFEINLIPLGGFRYDYTKSGNSG